MNFTKPLTAAQASGRLAGYFEKLQRKSPTRPLQVRVTAPRLGLDFTYPQDSTNQPYHLASIGKLFTATLVQILAERGQFSIKDPIQPYLSTADLERLFLYRGVDYARQVTVEHLLGHTSGVADYFEGHTTHGQSFLSAVLAQPQTRWTPQMLLDFTRANQAAVGAPGQTFNYSDTGYILLGLLVEKVTGKSFAQNLTDEIFRPLEMRDSYLMFSGEPLNTPAQPIEKIWFEQVEISQFTSLSCDWAGGGIVSTTGDLLKFSQALRSGRLLQPATLAAMDVCPRKFRPGIYYGLGMMEIHFSDFFFLLRGLPRCKGHIGILSTHLFYDPIHDAHIAMNFGDNTRMVASFRALIEIETTLQRTSPS